MTQASGVRGGGNDWGNDWGGGDDLGEMWGDGDD